MRNGTVRDTVPAYYPPRARWYTALLFRSGQQICRRAGLDKLHLTGELSWPGLFVSLVVPGFSFFIFGRRLLGWVFLPAYCLAGLVFVAALGFTAGSIAYGIMISLHATSIVFLEGYWLRDSGFGLRVSLALGTLVAVWALIYAPLVHFTENHWLFPVRLDGRVLLVHRGVSPAALQRGDLVVYRIGEQDSWSEARGSVILRSGLAIDPVLGLPGDLIRFTPQGVRVNTQSFPYQPYMPTAGELVVPEKVWFIWPSLAITVRGGVAAANITATLQRAALVTQTNIIGRPSHYWFGRRQWP